MERITDLHILQVISRQEMLDSVFCMMSSMTDQDDLVEQAVDGDRGLGGHHPHH